MKTDKTKFMGEDKIFPLLMKLSIPATIGMLVNALYNVIDTIFVGRGVGTMAIGALSVAFPIQMLTGSISHAIGIGSSSLVSIRLGEKKEDEAAKIVGTAISANTIIVTLISIFIYIFLDQTLKAFGASANILPFARDYIKIILLGFFFHSFAMTVSGLIRAEGNARVAMNGMLIGTLANIILDPIFIFGLNMGIKGAALATVIGQFLAFCYYASFYIKGKSHFQLTAKHFKPDINILKNSFILGLPTFMQMAGLSLLVSIINNLLGKYDGDISIAAYGIIQRLFSLIIMPLFGLVQGFQPIAGYNFGAKKYDRVREVLIKATLSATVVATMGFLVMFIFPAKIITLFTNNTELIAVTTKSLRLFVLCVPIIGIQVIGATYFQAVDKKRKSLFLSLSRQYLFLIPLIIILPKSFGTTGIWISTPISDFLATILTASVVVYELSHLKDKHTQT